MADLMHLSSPRADNNQPELSKTLNSVVGACSDPSCKCDSFKPGAFKKTKCQECFHSHTLQFDPAMDTTEGPSIKEQERLSSSITAPPKTGCQSGDCKTDIWKEGFCVEHYRLQAKNKNNPKNLSREGKKKLEQSKHFELINKKFLESGKYEITTETLLQYQKKFEEMDEDGSGDIDIMELGRAMEKLGTPKNQLELRKMIAQVDSTNTGTIDYEEFLTMMCGKSSSVLRIILMFERMAQGGKKEQKKGPPKKIDIYK